MKTVTERAYGKVNLVLAVGGKRPDGRHDVETVLCRVGIYDTVTVSEAAHGQIRLTSDVSGLPVNSENIAYLAALRYFEVSGKPHGIDIDIEKRIPIKAGMGGGSSDAASVLTALDKLYGDLSFSELHEIASGIGADVPFFLYGRSVMLGRGTGTALTPCGEMGVTPYGVFVTHGEKQSTGKAYETLDAKKNGDFTLKKADKLIEEIAKNDVFGIAGAIENDFELCSDTFSEVSGELYELGAMRAFLCGSGPTVCGLFPDRESAEAASKALHYPSFVSRVGV